MFVKCNMLSNDISQKRFVDYICHIISGTKFYMAIIHIKTVPPNNILFGGTVPPNNFLFGGTVPPNNFLFGGTVPPNSFPLFFTCKFFQQNNCLTTKLIQGFDPIEIHPVSNSIYSLSLNCNLDEKHCMAPIMWIDKCYLMFLLVQQFFKYGLMDFLMTALTTGALAWLGTH